MKLLCDRHTRHVAPGIEGLASLVTCSPPAIVEMEAGPIELPEDPEAAAAAHEVEDDAKAAPVSALQVRRKLHTHLIPSHHVL